MRGLSKRETLALAGDNGEGDGRVPADVAREDGEHRRGLIDLPVVGSVHPVQADARDRFGRVVRRLSESVHQSL